jgi:hypothetical protein
VNEHQLHLIARMRETFASYREGSLSLGSMVSRLEGLLDAGEFRDEVFTDTFLTLLGEFEEIHACQIYRKEQDLESPEVDPQTLRDKINLFLSFLAGYCPDDIG